MSTFLIIFGIVSLLGGLLFLFLSEGEDGWTGATIGIILLLLGLFGKYIMPDMIVTPKVEVISNNDSLQIPKDSIGEIIFVISYKDENGVWCGNNIKLNGRTEKNVGDTISIKLPTQ